MTYPEKRQRLLNIREFAARNPKVPYKLIGEKFGVSAMTVCRACRGQYRIQWPTRKEKQQ